MENPDIISCIILDSHLPDGTGRDALAQIMKIKRKY